MHSLFIKDVERNGVAANGVVDLFWTVRNDLARGEASADYPAVITALLHASIDRLVNGGSDKLKPGDADLLKNFTSLYVKYLSDRPI